MIDKERIEIGGKCYVLMQDKWRDIVRGLVVTKASHFPAQEALNELSDFNMMMDHLSRTYCHFSDGQISKPNTLPEEVFSIADEKETERTEEALAKLREENERLRAGHYAILGLLGDVAVLYPTGVKVRDMAYEALHGSKSPEKVK